MLNQQKHFFIVGCQRCGTSSLVGLLDAHPDIEMAKPFRPEPKFFLKSHSELNMSGYLGYFDKEQKKILRGEKSTSYIESEDALHRIKIMFPDAKIVLCLRDPVQRALSNYFFSKQNGLEKRSLEEVFLFAVPPPDSKATISVDPFDYIARGEYQFYIEKLYKIFSKNNVNIIFLEEFFTEKNLIFSLLNFLGVSENFIPGTYGKISNVSNKEKVNLKIIEKLTSHYIPHNKSLSDYLNYNLDFWSR